MNVKLNRGSEASLLACGSSTDNGMTGTGTNRQTNLDHTVQLKALLSAFFTTVILMAVGSHVRVRGDRSMAKLRAKKPVPC